MVVQISTGLASIAGFTDAVLQKANEEKPSIYSLERYTATNKSEDSRVVNSHSDVYPE